MNTHLGTELGLSLGSKLGHGEGAVLAPSLFERFQALWTPGSAVFDADHVDGTSLVDRVNEARLMVPVGTVPAPSSGSVAATPSADAPTYAMRLCADGTGGFGLVALVRAFYFFDYDLTPEQHATVDEWIVYDSALAA